MPITPVAPIPPVQSRSRGTSELNIPATKPLVFSNSLLINGCQPLKPLAEDTFEHTIKEPCQPLKPLTEFQEAHNNQKLSFGYRHPLKTAWKKGLLPTVKVDIYGHVLTKKNVSLEHIIPVSKGGRTVIDNLALADVRANNARGTKPIAEVITYEQLITYLNQFRNVKNSYINGNDYIRRMKRNAEKKWNFFPSLFD